MSTARHGTHGNTIKGLKNGTPEWWRCPKTLVTSPLCWQKYLNDDLRTQTQLIVMFHCQKMTQQGLPQLLLQCHPYPQRNFTSGTNQGFQNAKLIYFQQNNELNIQYLHFNDTTYIFLWVQNIELDTHDGLTSLSIRLWIRFLERWIWLVSRKKFKCKPTNSNNDISIFYCHVTQGVCPFQISHSDY